MCTYNREHIQRRLGVQKAKLGGGGLGRSFLVTVGHHKWLTAPPKSLIIHGAVCGKTGTSGYYLHGNFYNPQNLGARHPSAIDLGFVGASAKKSPAFPKDTRSGAPDVSQDDVRLLGVEVVGQVLNVLFAEANTEPVVIEKDDVAHRRGLPPVEEGSAGANAAE